MTISKQKISLSEGYKDLFKEKLTVILIQIFSDSMLALKVEEALSLI